MDAQALQTWLTLHADALFEFAHLEPTASSVETLHRNLGESWFRDPDWNDDGYTFLPLAMDGGGGEVAAWLPSHGRTSTSVVFFGPGGTCGVIAASPLAFVQALFHAPLIDWGSVGKPSALSIEERSARPSAEQALTEYRAAHLRRFGEPPPFEDIEAVPESVQAEFCSWVSTLQRRRHERDAAETIRAAENAAQLKRMRAGRLAAAHRATESAVETPSIDGAWYRGRCAGCSGVKQVRFTMFEQYEFGLCASCYFSKDVW